MFMLFACLFLLCLEWKTKQNDLNVLEISVSITPKYKGLLCFSWTSRKLEVAERNLNVPV